MEQNILKKIISSSGKISLSVIAAAVVAVVGVVIIIIMMIKKPITASINTELTTTLSPTEIRSIERIGEWEFLTIHDEEIVDTVRRGFLSTDELTRIYYGTLRLGINTHDMEPGWLRQTKDSIIVKLPPIRLLDKSFIDEARTKAFYQSGQWDNSAYEALYRKAYNKMLARCLTKQNMESARLNAQSEMRKILTAVGKGKKIVVR